MHTKLIAGTAKARRAHLLSDSTRCSDFGVHNSSVTNLERAILERVFFVQLDKRFQPPPKPTVDIDTRLHDFTKMFLKRVNPTTRWNNQQFADSYTGRKRTLYQKAVDSLVGSEVNRRDAYVDAFVKAEKINFSAKPDPAPRLIQPRRPRYNVAVGVYIKPIEHKIYKNIDRVFGATTVAKCMNASQMGAVFHEKWKKYTFPVAVGLDASRFDQHVSVDLLNWEHSIYLSFFLGRDKKRLKKLLSWQLENKACGKARDGIIKYVAKGCRMSGDMNTGLGNTLIMCGLVWTYMEELGFDYDLVNNGDDCVLVFDRHNLPLIDDLPRWFLEAGFTMKVETPVFCLEEIEFCQMHPVFDGLDYVMVRDIVTCLSKDMVTMKAVDVKASWAYQCQAISDCGMAAYGNMPIFNELYNTLNVGYHKSYVVESGLGWMSRGMNKCYAVPTPAIRNSFFKAFGIIPDRQIAMEAYLRNIKLQYRPGPIVKYIITELVV